MVCISVLTVKDKKYHNYFNLICSSVLNVTHTYHKFTQNTHNWFFKLTIIAPIDNHQKHIHQYNDLNLNFNLDFFRVKIELGCVD